MRKRAAALGLAALLCWAAVPSRAGAVSTSASAAILMDAESGRVLYEQNADKKMLIASTTKIMTALVAIREGNLSDTVKVSRKAAYTEGSSMYLKEGETLTLGKHYQEQLKVKNTGTINQYVRVSIYKYWLDAEGNKLRDLSPDLINLNLVNVGTDWMEDEGARTRERTVLYYSKLLYAEGEGASETSLFEIGRAHV